MFFHVYLNIITYKIKLLQFLELSILLFVKYLFNFSLKNKRVKQVTF